ncbi:hypothetical protein K8I28_09495 [bacterium]|nr:hypothetical protein [bacterium]
MREQEFHFLNEKQTQKIREATRVFIEKSADTKQFVLDLKQLLPVDKTDRKAVRSRVEGFYEASEILFQELLKVGREHYGADWGHKRIVSEAKLRPFSYYHYLAGSREPAANVRTRDDYLNDPGTALMKLEADIAGLGKLLSRIKNNSEAAPKS